MRAGSNQLAFVHRFIRARESGTRLTVLLLHGTGGNENDLLGLGRQLAPEAALLSPRGKVLEDGMPRFFRRLAEGIFDLHDLQERTHELADFVENASKVYQLASDRIFAVGFSNGANIATNVLLLRPEVLAGGILFRPMVPLVPAKMPHLAGKRVFLAAGRMDEIVTPGETERLRSLLAQAGADVILHWEEAGHGLIASEVEAARAWLRIWVVNRPDRAWGQGAKEKRG